MNISKWKIVWNFITGGGAGVVDYLLSILKKALDGLGDATKEKITAVLNLAMKVLSIAKAVRIFIPVKWQLAYELTIKAIETLISSLQDLDLTGEELKAIIEDYNAAYAAWMGPDDDTCVEPVEGRCGLLLARKAA